MLAKQPGAKVIYDVRASWAVPETIERAGGIALVNRVGHAFIKHRMRKEDAVFAGEVSAHYYFRDFSQADTGVVPFLLMLELISQRGHEALRDPARRTGSATSSPARSTRPSPTCPLKLQELKERYGAEGGASPTSTGSRSTSPTGTSTCGRRTPSRCSASTSKARSQELMEAKRDEVLALIRA